MNTISLVIVCILLLLSLRLLLVAFVITIIQDIGEKGLHIIVLIYKCKNRKGLMCLKKLMLIKPMSHAGVLFATFLK